MVMPGGCDRSDDFLPYIGQGMLFLRVVDILESIRAARSITSNNEDMRRLRDVSRFLFQAQVHYESLIAVRNDSRTLGEADYHQKAAELLRHASGRITLPGAVSAHALERARTVRNILNGIIADQLPTEGELEEARAYCEILSDVCRDLSQPGGCY